jgi:hypothetical protein
MRSLRWRRSALSKSAMVRRATWRGMSESERAGRGGRGGEGLSTGCRGVGVNTSGNDTWRSGQRKRTGK